MHMFDAFVKCEVAIPLNARLITYLHLVTDQLYATEI